MWSTPFGKTFRYYTMHYGSQTVDRALPVSRLSSDKLNKMVYITHASMTCRRRIFFKTAVCLCMECMEPYRLTESIEFHGSCYDRRHVNRRRVTAKPGSKIQPMIDRLTDWLYVHARTRCSEVHGRRPQWLRLTSVVPIYIYWACLHAKAVRL
jgi:hypothetical protein